MLTDKEALALAKKHGMKVTENPAAEKRMADFVRAIYKEGRDRCVMQIDSKGHVRSKA